MSKIGLSFIIFLLCIITSSCGSSGGSTGATKRNSESNLNVVVSKVEVRDLSYEVKTLGSLEPEELVQVTAQVSGAVSDVLFSSGDRVTPETVLLRIDPDRYRLEAERADAEYRRAVADWRRAEAEMQRREALARDGLVSDEELYRARQETERLSAIASASKAAQGIAGQNLQRSEVRSSRIGTISTRSVDPGQYVQAGAVLATLVNTARLRLRFKVSDAESLRVKDGQTVMFQVSSLGNRDFPARIYYVGAVADPSTRQVEVQAWVNNPGELKPGFFAEVSLETESHKGALVVPESAVQASERGFVVYVVNAGRAAQRTVQIGMRTGDGVVEIVSGVRPGETVVREGSDRLADGMAVQAVSDGVAENATEKKK